MKARFPLIWPVALVLIFAVGLSAGNVETKGKAWLAAHSEAAAINVNGEWHAQEWGRIVLNQAQGSRDVTGRGDGWDITGVVSGKQAFLLFAHRGTVNYSARLTSESDNSLDGSYARGFMDAKSKGKAMHLTKR